MHLSLTKDCYLTVEGPQGRAIQLNIEDALGVQKVFDWFGNKHPVNVLKEPSEEKRFMLGCSSGELMVVGASHSILCRRFHEARWKRVPISEIDEPVFVQLPQRKTSIDPELFDLFDFDDEGPYLEPTRPSDMPVLARKAAWGGLHVSRRKTEARLDLDKRRPACYATKLLAGSFERDLETTLANFARSAIVRPCQMFDDDYLYKVRQTGVVFEGYAVVNSVILLPPKPLEKEGPVYHIRLDSPMTPVELTWFQS